MYIEIRYIPVVGAVNSDVLGIAVVTPVNDFVATIFGAGAVGFAPANAIPDINARPTTSKAPALTHLFIHKPPAQIV